MSTSLTPGSVASPNPASQRKTPTVAYVDGQPVPTPMNRLQVKAIFPHGAPALVSGDGDVIVVNDEGGFDLTPNARYTTLRQRDNDHSGSRGGVSRTPAPSGDGLCPPDSPPPQRVRHGAPPGASDLRPLESCKTIMDRVHDHVPLPRLIVDIIDTPEFQRLRGLRQVGSTFYLYPGATHTRFEHSIGVAHLAALMARRLQLGQPELGITDKDILCVMAGGLCHDIGHGPFSHLFEDVIKRVLRAKGEGRQWHHEAMSVALVRRVLGRADLSQYGLNQQDIEFIVLCIEGLPPDEPWPTNVGRPESLRFLPDIVSNKRNGVDVDKLDYFMRDSLCCYGRASVDCHIPRLLESMRVIRVEGQPQICFEEKLAQPLSDIFQLRAKLHKYAYQHRVCRVIDLMISDALEAAEPYFKIRSEDGIDRTLSECVDSLEGFIKLGDWILPAIESSADDRLKPAQDILRRLSTRQLYLLAGQAAFVTATDETPKMTIRDQIAAFLPAEIRETVRPTIAVDFTLITFGSYDKKTGRADDPISHVSFYNPKSNPDAAFQLPSTRQSPLFSPADFAEKTILCFVRDDAHRDIVLDAFNAWKARYRPILATPVPTFNSPAGGRRHQSGLSVERSDTKKKHRVEVRDPMA